MQHVILTGFMASGKTAVGRRLAKRLGWDFLDLDEFIEQSQGRSISEIFAAEGEQEFRRLEREAVAGLELERATVIATGGGTIAQEANRKRLAKLGVVVHLVVALPTVLERVAGNKRRPLAEGKDAAERLARLLEERAPAYRRADVLVETDGLSIDQAVARVLAMIEPRLRDAGKRGSRAGSSKAAAGRAAAGARKRERG